MIDLHTHTTASDGELKPEELIKLAVSTGLRAMAVTDHDTLEGLIEAKTAADSEGITFIPGIELNIGVSSGEFHLLGLGIEINAPSILTLLERAQNSRHNRNMAMIAKIQEAGIDCSYDAIKDYALAHSPYIKKNLGRPHIADYLVYKGIAQNRQDAFTRYLARGKPFYVANEGIKLGEAVTAIKASCGIAVVAHPLSLYASWNTLPELFRQFRDIGVDGIEAWHPLARLSEAERLEEMALDIGLIVTAGSDFHGAKLRPDRHLGYTSGGLPIDDRFYNNLKEALAHNRNDTP